MTPSNLHLTLQNSGILKKNMPVSPIIFKHAALSDTLSGNLCVKSVIIISRMPSERVWCSCYGNLSSVSKTGIVAIATLSRSPTISFHPPIIAITTPAVPSAVFFWWKWCRLLALLKWLKVLLYYLEVILHCIKHIYMHISTHRSAKHGNLTLRSTLMFQCSAMKSYFL